MSEAESLLPKTNLRGASVQVDAQRVGRLFIGLGAVALVTFATVFLFVGLSKNNQITQLQRAGVAVEARVSGCLGELGGTGSNAAGYSCKGSFTLDGNNYQVTIPGDALRIPGSRVRIVALSTDPRLVETQARLANEHASAGVFVLPIALYAAFIVVVGAVVMVRRRSKRT
jgi:uncharacterized membrane protein